jgi:hypothetical protein
MASADQDLPMSGSENQSEHDSLNSSESASSPARTAPNKRVRVRERFSCWSFSLAKTRERERFSCWPFSAAKTHQN